MGSFPREGNYSTYGCRSSELPRLEGKNLYFELHFKLITQDEAFALWQTHWGSLYPEGSESRRIITQIQNTYYLVNLVDNDFVRGNKLFDLIDEAFTVLSMYGKKEVTTPDEGLVMKMSSKPLLNGNSCHANVTS